MDHSWRPPPLPPIPGNASNICPICSISHFPFCPPPPFIENPRFHYSQSPNDYHNQPPHFDHHHSFPNHQSSLNYNYDCNPSDGYVARRPTWYGSNPSLNMSPYDGVGDPPMGNGNYNNYHRGGVGPASYGYDGYDNGGTKRMKIEPTDYNRGPRGSSMGGEIVDTSRVSSDSERILKLIHDHGNAANAAPGGLPKTGADLFSESSNENANRYTHGRFVETREVRNDMGLKRRQMSDFPSTGMGSFERKESSLYVGPGSDLLGSSREDRGVAYGKNNVHYDQRDELGQSQYDCTESSIPHSLNYSRHGSQPARVFTSTEQSEQTQDHHRGAAPYHSVLQRSELNKKLPMPQEMHDPTTEILPNIYHHLQPTTPSNVAIVNKASYSYAGQSQLPPPADTTQHNLQPNHSFLSSRLPTDVNRHVDVNALSQEGIPSSIRHHNSQPPYSWSESKGHYAHNSFRTNFGPVEVSHAYRGQPPLPASPPPPLPIDPPRHHVFEPLASPPAKKPSLFPISVSSSADSSSSRSAIHENQSPAQVYYSNNAGHHASTLSSAEEFRTRQSSSEKHVRDVQPFPLRHLASEKPNTIDASHIFKQPHRASRPDHLVIILRGLPGSGKSYLAKVLRDIEVDNGGEAPRIHSMDEYFMTEVEKAEDSELSKSSGSLRGKRQVMKKVMEYCYEPEMEEAYRASMLKAFKKTLDEGIYSFIIVDDRNLRVADFAQFWATAKRSGYEVYLVEAAYKDPAGCAARNVHNFTLDDIQKMAGQWEEAPSLYLKMDIKSLLHGDGFDESGIQEVDMDMEDEDAIEASPGPDVKNPQEDVKDQVDEHELTPHGPVKHPVTNHVTEEVNHLSRSKWSNDMDGRESLEAEGGKKNASALSGLIQAYGKEGKSVRWGDQGGNVGFSISATRKTNTRSLIIGPGSGYNLKSNPLSEEEYLKPTQKAVEPKSQNVFQERIRAERESFKAVFDKRQQRRIGGFDIDDE
ncbi:uncharacterized protein LOC112511082 isoform X2 [Cynara cardunculus var. scolymus]|uniref:uncharacterized protein LOC112511082 isoform X2 n=1 Tax=Cynara cardunculus var. scolymus TaxID=59895 RepID=UPI000D62D95D|nr:uncharacterized protein LOC112511082 isoform X2 [Cynara cardunculus var. scolymus]